MRVEAHEGAIREQGRHCVVGIARLRWREVAVHRPGASRSGRHEGRRCVRSARRDASGWDSLTPTECTVAGLVAGACPTGEAGAKFRVTSHGPDPFGTFTELDISSSRSRQPRLGVAGRELGFDPTNGPNYVRRADRPVRGAEIWPPARRGCLSDIDDTAGTNAQPRHAQQPRLANWLTQAPPRSDFGCRSPAWWPLVSQFRSAAWPTHTPCPAFIGSRGELAFRFLVGNEPDSSHSS